MAAWPSGASGATLVVWHMRCSTASISHGEYIRSSMEHVRVLPGLQGQIAWLESGGWITGVAPSLLLLPLVTAAH